MNNKENFRTLQIPKKKKEFPLTRKSCPSSYENSYVQKRLDTLEYSSTSSFNRYTSRNTELSPIQEIRYENSVEKSQENLLKNSMTKYLNNKENILLSEEEEDEKDEISSNSNISPISCNNENPMDTSIQNGEARTSPIRTENLHFFKTPSIKYLQTSDLKENSNEKVQD